MSLVQAANQNSPEIILNSELAVGVAIQTFLNTMNQITTVVYSNASTNTPVLEALISPAYFPSCFASKQFGLSSPNLHFRRIQGAHSLLREAILSGLVGGGRKVISLLGGSGQGKSHVLDDALIDLAQHMIALSPHNPGSVMTQLPTSSAAFQTELRLRFPGRPVSATTNGLFGNTGVVDRIYYQLESGLHMISLGPTGFQVNSERSTTMTHLIDRINADMNSATNAVQYPVVLLELSDGQLKQLDVQLMPYPMFFSVSNRAADKATSSKIISSRLVELMYGMCSWEEINCMGVAELDFLRDDTTRCVWATDRKGNRMNRLAALRKLMYYNIDCGPVPRACFQNMANYADTIYNITSVNIDVTSFDKQIGQSVTGSFPPGTGLFFAVVVDPEIGTPFRIDPLSRGNSHYFVPVSKFAARCYATRVNSDRTIKVLQEFNLLSQLQEEIAVLGLAMAVNDKDFVSQYSPYEWKAYVDVGDNPLIQEAECQWSMEDILKVMKTCTREVYFPGSLFNMAAQQMVPGVVYRPASQIHNLFDFLFLAGNSVILVQVSRSSPQVHSFSMETLDAALKNLQLHLPSVTIDVVYVYVTDEASVDLNVKGLLMSYHDATSNHRKNVGLLKWRKLIAIQDPLRPPLAYEWFVNRLSTVVVRAKFFPSVPMTSTPIKSITDYTLPMVKKLLSEVQIHAKVPSKSVAELRAK